MGSGPASDQNLRAFVVEGHWHRGGLSSRAMGSQASPGVVGASRCPVWGIRSPGVHAGQRWRKQSWVGLSRTSAFRGWAGVERRTSAWPGQRTLDLGQGYLPPGREGLWLGYYARREGSGYSPGQAQRQGPSPAADEPLLSSLPSPLGFTVASAQPGEGNQQLPKTSGTSSWHRPSHPSSLRSCSSLSGFLQSRGFLQQRVAGPGASSAPGGRGRAVKLQLCVALGKSLLSEP